MKQKIQASKAKERKLTIPSSTQIAKFLGLNPRTFNQIKQKAQLKRDLLEKNKLQMESYKQELCFLN